MANLNWPSISVVMPTYDGSDIVLERCLNLVREQDYPQEKIEIVLGNGGTSKKILEIAKTYHAKVIQVPAEKQHAEYNRGIAFNQAKNELVLILDNDNFLPYQTWLKDMVTPLLKHEDVVAVETCFYQYDSSLGIIDRYFALLGCSEPLPFYLGKADRMPWGSKTWTLAGKAVDMGKYYLVELPPVVEKFPTVGSNACLMRRKQIMENADVRPDHHYPIDVMFDAASKGLNKFAFVKNSVIHQTGYKGFWAFFKRRYLFANKYHFGELSKRRYSLYTPKDFWKVLWFAIISLTIVIPTFDALKGFIKYPDIAWFLHPIMAFMTTIIYTFMSLKNWINKKYS